MGGIVVPFENRAQREKRLHRELMARYRAYMRAEEPAIRDALLQALDRLVAFQMRYSRPNRLEAPQKGCCVCLLARRPTGHRTDAGTP